MSSVEVIRAAVFGIADSPYLSRVREGKLHVTLPVSRNGSIPAKPPKTPFYQVGLCAEVLRLRDNIGPDNLRLLDVESVKREGEEINLEDALESLPEKFFDALGTVNEEIQEATGFNPDEQLAFPEFLTVSKSEPGSKKTGKAQGGPITSEVLKSLNLDVERLEQSGLTIEVLNQKGITVEQLQKMAFQ